MVEPCPYCHKDSEGYVRALGTFFIDLGNHLDPKPMLRTQDTRVKPREIKHCFMCGRNLLEEE